MTNKASLLLAALLAFPAVAIAQTPPPAPPAGGPTAPTAPSGQPMRHDMTWPPSAADMAHMKAEMAKLQAQMAKAEAAHKATRAKILAVLTPAHRAYLATMIGQLAVAANPDPKAATAKLDGMLTASEKSQILAIHAAAEAQMMTEMRSLMPAGVGPAAGGMMRYKRLTVFKNADGTTTTSSRESTMPLPPGPPGAPPMSGTSRDVTFFMGGDQHGMMRARHAMTAGEILMHLAGLGEIGAPMMIRSDAFRHGPVQWRHHAHPMMPLTPPAAPPVAPVTPAPQPTP